MELPCFEGLVSPVQRQIYAITPQYHNKNKSFDHTVTKKSELQAMHIGKLFLVVNNQFSLSKIKYANLNNISECKN